MTSYEKLCIARKAGRPTSVAYIDEILTDTLELHGDRRFGDDGAIVGGIGCLDGMPVTYIAIEKGVDLESRMRRNFGCPKPEGYRKALRLMKQAEKFSRPVICFVDTLGAFCGADAEERGQGGAIAENIMEMMGLRTPVISIVIGEGGSGGALGLAAADKVYMLENSVYSVISPEGCASIIWKDSKMVEQAADCLHITAEDMQHFGVAEEIVKENFDDFGNMCSEIKRLLSRDFARLCKLDGEQLIAARYERFRKIGIFAEI